MYVVETDAPCKICNSQHGVVTRGCRLVIYVDGISAGLTAKVVDGKVREIDEPPADLSYELDITKGGFPDPAYKAQA